MPKDNSSHLDDDEIEQFVRGEADQAELEVWEEHLLICGECRQEIENEEHFAAGMRSAGLELRRQERTRETTRWQWNRLVPGFAALAAAALIAALWVSGGSRTAPSAAPIAITLRAMRGSETSVSATAGRRLDLRMDVTELAPVSSYRVEIVDSAGEGIWSGTAEVRGAEAETRAPEQKPGDYFVRLYQAGGTLVREFALHVQARD